MDYIVVNSLRELTQLLQTIRIRGIDGAVLANSDKIPGFLATIHDLSL